MRVSVAMAAYNSGKYIKPQLDSILKQLTKDDELVISYNPSTDDTLSILEEYADNYSIIKIVRCDMIGFRANFNSAITNTSGDYIFLSDHDDIWLDTKIDTVLNAFKDGGADLVIHSRIVTDKELNPISQVSHKEEDFTLFSCIRHNSFCGCCMAFRKEMIPIVCPLPTKIVYHDMWIGLLALLTGRVRVIDKPLILYRRHDNNESFDRRRKLGDIIIERVYTMVCVGVRIIKTKFLNI